MTTHHLGTWRFANVNRSNSFRASTSAARTSSTAQPGWGDPCEDLNARFFECFNSKPWGFCPTMVGFPFKVSGRESGVGDGCGRWCSGNAPRQIDEIRSTKAFRNERGVNSAPLWC